MKVEVCWENETHSVLRCTLSGDWDWAEFYRVIDQETLFREPGDPCLIVDMRAVTHMPIDMVLHLKRAIQLISKLKGLVVLIATSVTASTAYHAMITLYKPIAEKIRLVSNDQEAYAVLGLTF